MNELDNGCEYYNKQNVWGALLNLLPLSSKPTLCTQPCDAGAGTLQTIFSFASWLHVSSPNGKHQRETAWLQETVRTRSFLSVSCGLPVPIQVTLASPLPPNSGSPFL